MPKEEIRKEEKAEKDEEEVNVEKVTMCKRMRNEKKS